MRSVTGEQMVYQGFKRLMDIVFGLFGVICLLSLMLLVKISFLVMGIQNLFYAQTRVGLNGQPFKMYKFRCFVWNADKVFQELLKDPKDAKEWEENQELENDRRPLWTRFPSS